MTVLTVATRAGKLAMTQTQMVVDSLLAKNPQLQIHVKQIITSGDKDRRTALWDVGQTGFFTTQVEDAVLNKEADFAVHSFKDLPTKERDGLKITTVFKRQSAEDCLIAKEKLDSINQLPIGAKIGTSSLRRAVQIKQLREDLEIVPIRGNVFTRIKYVDEGKMDAVVLAKAGLERLNFTDRISLSLAADKFIPAPAQGALAIQTRFPDPKTEEIISSIDDPKSRITALAERQLLAFMHCGCRAPFGAFAEIVGNDIMINAFLSDEAGEKFIRQKISGPVNESQKLIEKLGKDMLDMGGREILKKLGKYGR